MVVNLSPTRTGCKVAVGSVWATALILSLDPHFLKVEGDIRKLQKIRETAARLRQTLAGLYNPNGLAPGKRGVVALCT